MSYDNVIFAGGGSRCLWQVGFWEGAKHAGLDLQSSVSYVASTSAGCAMATACAVGKGAEGFAMFMDMTEKNPSNIHWHNLRPGSGQPLLPHMGMYREALNRLLCEDDLKKLDGIVLEFLMARYPQWLPSTAGVLLAFSIYGLEKHLTGVLHPRWTRQLGFEPLVKGNQDVQSIEGLIEIILASSTVPPVLPTGGYQGQRVLDGGLIDNVPAFLSDERPGRTLVLLSKRYKKAPPSHDSRVYVQPSEPIRIDKFDYANPQGLEDTYRLGWKDAQTFAQLEQANVGEPAEINQNIDAKH